MLLQRLAGGVGELLLPFIVVAVPGGLGRADALLAPTLVQDLYGAFLGALRDLGLRDFHSLEQTGGLGFFHRFEHHIGLEQLPDMGLELECGQLQKPNCLLQLRGHRQGLTQLELQGRFQHGDTGGSGGLPILNPLRTST